MAKRRWRGLSLALVAVALLWLGVPSPAAADPPSPVLNGFPANGLCLICHSEPGLTAAVAEGHERPLSEVDPAAYKASAHGEEDCVSCHSGEAALPHTGEGAEAQPPSTSATGCSTCHADALESYLDSPHGTMVNLGDTRAPACTDCHGEAHDVKPVEEWPETDKAEACAECHPGAGTEFLQAVSHEEPSPGFLPLTYFAGRFLILLTAGVLAFGIIHVELDVLRWIARRWRKRSGRT